ncbi:hypothetical protein BDY21DRAFT_342743 [Lineolata rhizophorae]|uniref:Uncharacterized protein n=1 Tax=Lineolata rhizophorae TaxID=578093 RepID=A0A6A6P1X7_9PEZI|nr:hypothetical protein BDY21DRAFT_342743 [Lineolata rhizophorae]
MSNPSSSLPTPRRGHGRMSSADERRRVAVPRRSTKGPLDSDVDEYAPPPARRPRSAQAAR